VSWNRFYSSFATISTVKPALSRVIAHILGPHSLKSNLRVAHQTYPLIEHCRILYFDVNISSNWARINRLLEYIYLASPNWVFGFTGQRRGALAIGCV
jgi:hypothetical protein